MKRLLLTVLATAALAACSTGNPSGSNTSGWSDATLAETKAVRERADYWQRADTVSAQYMVGPKAQHQLNKDIAACVAEVRELVRLGSVRKASAPPSIAMDPPLRAGWYSPTRDGPLYTEYTDYQDFDGCMRSKGWERVDYVRPVVAQKGARNYVATILGHPFGWGLRKEQDNDSTQDNSFNR